MTSGLNSCACTKQNGQLLPAEIRASAFSAWAALFPPLLSSGELLLPQPLGPLGIWRPMAGRAVGTPEPFLNPSHKTFCSLSFTTVSPGISAVRHPTQLTQLSDGSVPPRNIRVAILPCSESSTCLFRTRPLDSADTLVFNEAFWVSMSYPALHQKTLRVDVCTTDRSHAEECLVRAESVSVCLST